MARRATEGDEDLRSAVHTRWSSVLVFPRLEYLRKLSGAGPRAGPLACAGRPRPATATDSVDRHREEADQRVGRGRGRPPIGANLRAH